jgi:hypothetical protein
MGVITISTSSVKSGGWGDSLPGKVEVSSIRARAGCLHAIHDSYFSRVETTKPAGIDLS